MPTLDRTCGPRMEFHVSRKARDRYQFDQSLFTLQGNVLFAHFRAARLFAQKMNDKRDLLHFPEQTVKAGQLNAMGLIDEILHFVVAQYRKQRNPEAMGRALATLDARLGAETVDAALRRFADDFPPLAVYRREVNLAEYLAGETGGVSHRQVVLEEMLLLWLANVNPAFGPYLELFDDAALEKDTAYLAVIEGLREFFVTEPHFGPDDEPLVAMLRAPAIAHPYSLTAQLEYMLTRWAYLLGEYLYRLLASLDFVKEEEKAIFLGPGPSLVYDYAGMEDEPERFSADKDWMPRVVMIAKNAYVWLDQLAKKYGRTIARLDDIPDEELDTLARWGFTCLWLIGLWERSTASKRIKELCGNADAVASAYSLYDYLPAGDLGGQDALDRLRQRAWQRGIRLASDMVPNHVGIDSRWVVEHPDWFIALDHSPFPAYSFSGPNLSHDDRVGIYLEDHYYSRNDAAVVFKRVDQWTGSEKYIYHGNDGTSMPWNDTAQLNYLIPEVREAVIQTILHVARNFPVIRFDAAMTLAKKHYQRLWFPEPGNGGAIPSRAGHGMTRPHFNSVFPVEFWREVVDRVAAEAPDTLLLAEAFWLMEGYFVRTLGMHRVYNSAFMNMLRDEDNAKYRSVMKNTMEFDVEIMKRFVNFMNNPDERTAVDQFGSGDKYFGICAVMATLPGLPMFGHGQIEGFSEKYGMEFHRAYWDEQPNGYLMERHEREIFPLLHRRRIFAEARDFLLYDLFTPQGYVNEDVFAYSNRCGDERGLVVYHNKYAETCGWIRASAAYTVKMPDGSKHLQQRCLGEGLGLQPDGECWTIFRDQINGLEYLRNSKELWEQGMYVELHAYQYHVFLDFREVRDNEWRHYANLAAYLQGRGVPSIDEALRELFLQPVHVAYKALVNAELFRELAQATTRDTAVLDAVEEKARVFLAEVKRFSGGTGDEVAVAQQVRETLEAVLARLETREDPAVWGTLLAWVFTHALGRVAAESDCALQGRSLIDEWLLGRIITATLRELGADETTARHGAGWVQALTTHQQWAVPAEETALSASTVLARWLADPDLQNLLQINRHNGILWFSKEGFDALCAWMLRVAEVTPGADLPACREVLDILRAAEGASGYQVELLLEAAASPALIEA